jgi:hypothetical protein
MSYSRVEGREDAEPQRMPLSWLTRAAGVVVWAVINAAILFAEQLAELLAPLLLLAGAVWWAIPRGLDALKLDGPANDILQQVRAHVPSEIFVSGSYYSAHTLISDGLWCIAVVAICRTLSNLLTNLLLERP